MTEILKKLVVDCSTNTAQELELTNAEIVEINNAATASKIRLETAQAEATTKAAQRRAILEHLKITEEEARILLGGN